MRAGSTSPRARSSSTTGPRGARVDALLGGAKGADSETLRRAEGLRLVVREKAGSVGRLAGCVEMGRRLGRRGAVLEAPLREHWNVDAEHSAYASAHDLALECIQTFHRAPVSSAKGMASAKATTGGHVNGLKPTKP